MCVCVCVVCCVCLWGGGARQHFGSDDLVFRVSEDAPRGILITQFIQLADPIVGGVGWDLERMLLSPQAARLMIQFICQSP